MRYYAGLDVSNKRTSFCIIDQDQKIVKEGEVNSEAADIAAALNEHKDKLEIVGLESGAMCFWLAEGLIEFGYPAKVLDARNVASVLSTVINKTDKNDARGIAKILRAGYYTVVHQKSKMAIEVGTVMGLRAAAVRARVLQKNNLRGILKNYGIRIKTTGDDSFMIAVEQAIEGLDPIVKQAVTLSLQAYQYALNVEAGYEKLVEELAKKHAVCRLMMTTHGVGPIIALEMISEIDNPDRFRKSPKAVGAYLGLTPSQYSSGETTRLGPISRAGSRRLRSLLYDAAVVMITRSKKMSSIKSWALRKLKKGKPFKKVATAVARKIAVALVRMWQTGEPFRTSEIKDQAPGSCPRKSSKRRKKEKATSKTPDLVALASRSIASRISAFSTVSGCSC